MRVYSFDVLERESDRLIGRVTVADGEPRALIAVALRWARAKGVRLGKAREVRQFRADAAFAYVSFKDLR